MDEGNSFKYIVTGGARACAHVTLVHLKRIMVNFTDEQWTVLERFRGLFGNTDSEIVKYVLMSYLSEKTYIKRRIEEQRILI